MDQEARSHGLRCDIYRPTRGDRSNGGISGRVDHVTMVGPNVPRISRATDDVPAVEPGMTGGAVNARPAGQQNTWWMHGGCFIWTSDARFPSPHPVPLHDRAEKEELAQFLKGGCR